MKVLRLSALLATCALFAGSADASQMVFTINANGAKEVTSTGTPNQGDPDGTAVGTITLDNGTGNDNTGSAVIALTIANINGTLDAHHIHVAPATSTGGVVLNLGSLSGMFTGTTVSGVNNGTLSGTVSNLPAANISNVFNNPSGFYYNLHTSGTGGFPAGAVRDQLVPEPALGGLLATSALTLLSRRRRA